LINALRYFKKEIFTKNNEDFVNIINVLTTLWNRGQKSEDKVLSKIESYFGKNSSVEKIGGHGQKSDAIKGIDLIVNVGDKKYTSQVKPYSTFKQDGDKIIVFDTGNVKPYNVDWMIFINTKSNKIIIFKNNPIQDQNQYVFDVSSLIHQID
jgi:hypothetical protein